ncbi:hypothetical protein C0Z18_10780 [Trinickia dabaoshanensis]|uniref:Uncharacterized protein n=1 Tax=Trinickia dabaoshanensis TaxID=564714 RepID=A0A2N7VTF0_9BURK|nr:hypothetical protein [Trinickia dabaoshanensis]PMS20415.1 hypothetical protein C0Z18_10780 [Trinickia dabaoshanensis]
MSEVSGDFVARAASQQRAAQWAAHTGVSFALEKRRVDAQSALAHIEGRAKTELINALRGIGQHLRP